VFSTYIIIIIYFVYRHRTWHFQVHKYWIGTARLKQHSQPSVRLNKKNTSKNKRTIKTLQMRSAENARTKLKKLYLKCAQLVWSYIWSVIFVSLFKSSIRCILFYFVYFTHAVSRIGYLITIDRLCARNKSYTPFTRWSKHEAKIKQTYSIYTCTTCVL